MYPCESTNKGVDVDRAARARTESALSCIDAKLRGSIQPIVRFLEVPLLSVRPIIVDSSFLVSLLLPTFKRSTMAKRRDTHQLCSLRGDNSALPRQGTVEKLVPCPPGRFDLARDAALLIQTKDEKRCEQ